MSICKAHDFLRNEAYTVRRLLFFPGKSQRDQGEIGDGHRSREATWKYRYISLPKLELFGAVEGSVGELRRATP
jgi:hypothetical protein